MLVYEPLMMGLWRGLIQSNYHQTVKRISCECANGKLRVAPKHNKHHAIDLSQ